MLPDHLKEFPVAASLEAGYADAIVGGHDEHGELSLFVTPDAIVDVCRFLKSSQQFNRLSGITAVDWHPEDPRFEAVYLLHSTSANRRLRLKCRLREGEEIESVTSVWRSANWYEREIYDLFGIPFMSGKR